MTGQNNSLDNLRHSCAHLLAAAVIELYPQAQRAIGPPITDGFYYDFDFGDEKLSETDLERIEQKMKELLPAWIGFERREVTAQEAREVFIGNPYKLELIDELSNDGQTLTLYKSGSYTDLCRGGHCDEPAEELKHFKLLSIAGAYWRGNERNKMLTRLYGTCFPTQKELEDYIARLEEAKKRDHRKLGRDLDLFTFADEVGPGLPLWKPKGTLLRDQLESWAKTTEAAWGYERVATPHIAKHTLYEISGHLPYYKEDMYSPMEIDGEEYYLKGMNCPHHHLIYKSSPKSYRDLPVRYAEYGMVYRYEQSGTLFGLMRVRALEQNDAHIYCEEDKAEDEFLRALELHEYYYGVLGLTKDDYHIVIGLPDETKRDKYHGDRALWDKAERIMRSAILRSGIRFVDEVGGAAFYGPKIDFVITSSIGREFAISTVQLDLYMPIRFGLDYTDITGQKKHCAVIHRAPLGSHERFIGFLIEHFAGNFPLWLSPVQVVLLPVGSAHHDFARQQAEVLRQEGVRVQVDDGEQTVGKKIRAAELQKTPYIVVVGDKEMQSGLYRVRVRGQKDQPEVKAEQFLATVREKTKNKDLLLGW